MFAVACLRRVQPPQPRMCSFLGAQSVGAAGLEEEQSIGQPHQGLRSLDKWLCTSSAGLLPTAGSDERRQITRGHHGQATCSSRYLVARGLRSAAKDQDVRRVECEMSTGILGAFRGHAPVRLRTDRNSFLGPTGSGARELAMSPGGAKYHSATGVSREVSPKIHSSIKRGQHTRGGHTSYIHTHKLRTRGAIP